MVHSITIFLSNLPNFFVIGAAKAGTTALYRYLSEHPQVSMSTPKEPHFFAPGAGPAHRRVSDRRSYEALFSASAIARGEASTSYSMYPRWSDVALRIHELVPRGRLIYLVRDPVERLQSWFANTEVPGRRASDFDRWLGDPYDARNERIASSRYMTQIREYLRRFAPEQLLVIDHDDLWHDRHGTLQEVFGFLGVDAHFWVEALESAHNTSGMQRRLSASGARIYQSRPLAHAVQVIPRRARPAARRASDAVFRRTIGPPHVGDDTREMLTELLREEMAQLRSFTGKAFPRWSM